MAETGSARGARAAAVALLGGVLEEGALMAQLLAAPDGPLRGLPPQERARAQRLATGVLRQLGPIDKVLTAHLRKTPPPFILNILRLAVHEIAGGAARHGVVHSAVDLTRTAKRTEALSGLVNAVLRALPDPLTLPPQPQLLPRWLRQPLVHLWGREVVAAIEAVQAQEPPLDLTLNGSLHPEGTMLPTGSLRLSHAGQISTLPGYAEGHWWVQDAAAALAMRLLAPMPGETVLDLCAAPGGKTLQAAAAGAAVTALDISGPRMARVAENLSRCRLAAKLVTADALVWEPDERFDAVLLDAPCSATGTIRRHPDLPFVKDGSELPKLAELQARLFDRALSFLKPGGRLVYCTCSLLPEEGEAQLRAVLTRHPGLTVRRPDLPGVDPDWITLDGGLRLRPDYWAAQGGMDGFFMACVTL
jgi:16S rRNA (cytosine967-C5)-methyltransferase